MAPRRCSGRSSKPALNRDEAIVPLTRQRVALLTSSSNAETSHRPQMDTDHMPNTTEPSPEPPMLGSMDTNNMPNTVGNSREPPMPGDTEAGPSMDTNDEPPMPGDTEAGPSSKQQS